MQKKRVDNCMKRFHNGAMGKPHFLRLLCAVSLTVALLGMQTVSAEWMYFSSPVPMTSELKPTLGEFLYKSEEVLPEEVNADHQMVIEEAINGKDGLNSSKGSGGAFNNALDDYSVVYAQLKGVSGGNLMSILKLDTQTELGFAAMYSNSEKTEVRLFTYYQDEADTGTPGLTYILTYATVCRYESDEWVNMGSVAGYAQVYRHPSGFRNIDPTTWVTDLD